MSVDLIVLDVKNLSVDEQLKLFLALWRFADGQLPDDKTLFLHIKGGLKNEGKIN
jgi:hypothetical protein